MSHKPLTYFTIFSVAAHAALFGVWAEPEMSSSVSHESSIEIGLVTLPRIEKDFSTQQEQAHKESRQQPARESAEAAETVNDPPPVTRQSEPAVNANSKNSNQADAATDDLSTAEPVRPDANPATATRNGSSPVVATEAAPLTSSNPAPQYPAEALRYGWEGEVWLKVDVDRNGAVYRVRIDKSSGYPVLDRAALKTVRRWLFEPARIGPETIDATVRVPVRFRIKRS